MPATAPTRRGSSAAPSNENRPAAPAGPNRPGPRYPKRDFSDRTTGGGPATSEPSRPPVSEAPILFQDYFKSPGPRTYAAQVKRAKNENHFLVLTEGKRDEKTAEVRKTKLLVFSEDFDAFFEMLDHVRKFIQANPVPREVAQRQRQFWQKRGEHQGG